MSESYNQYGLGPTTLCAHGLPNLDTRCPYCERHALRAEVERLKKALGYITDISEANADRAIVEMKRIAHEALDSAPAEEEGRDE